VWQNDGTILLFPTVALMLRDTGIDRNRHLTYSSPTYRNGLSQETLSMASGMQESSLAAGQETETTVHESTTQRTKLRLPAAHRRNSDHCARISA